MLLRRLLLGFIIVSVTVAVPAADPPSDAEKKAIEAAKTTLTKAEAAAKDSKDALTKAETAAKDAKTKSDAAAKASTDKPTDEPLKKAAADAKAALEKADKTAADAKTAATAADKAATDAKDALAKLDKTVAVPEKAAKAMLKWKFEEGKDFYQKMYTKTAQTMTVMGNKVVQTQEQTFYFKWSVVKAKDDLVTIKQKIEGVVMKIDIGNQKIEYDSTTAKEGASNPLADFFKALKDSEFTITLNTKKMEVTELEGHKEFIDKLGKQNPQMKPLLETILSKNAMMQMAAPTFSAIPGDEQAVNATWTKKTSLDMGPIGKYENEYKYTYEGKDKDKTKLDKIKVETTLKYTPPTAEAGAGSGGLPFKIKSADLNSTEAKGDVLFDPERGRIEKSTMTLKLKGKLSIEIGGQVTEVELDQVQDSTVENNDKSLIPVAEKK